MDNRANQNIEKYSTIINQKIGALQTEITQSLQELLTQTSNSVKEAQNSIAVLQDETQTATEKAEGKMHQSEHKVTLEENRIETKEKESRAARTHRLCTRAGHIEFLIPETKELTDNQFMEFCDALFSFPGIRAHIERILFDIKLKEMD